MDTLSDDVLRVIRDVFGIKTDPSEALKDLQKKVKAVLKYYFSVQSFFFI